MRDLDFLVENLQKQGILKTQKIIEAFRAINRADFVLEEMKNLAYVDEALPIKKGQTVSQPLTVAFMLELLSPGEGKRVMDVGYGSGWQTAILAYIVGERGKIYAVERVPELCDFGKNNIAKYNFIEKGIVETFCQNAFGGLPDIAEKIGGFDGIIAAASLEKRNNSAAEDALPKAWKDQLKIDGRIVVPIKNSVWLFIKNRDGSFTNQEYPGFVFVPFIK